MTNIYDMVSGEFIEDETILMDNACLHNDIDHGNALNLQLQLVEIQHQPETCKLPADLAYQAFIKKT